MSNLEGFDVEANIERSEQMYRYLENALTCYEGMRVADTFGALLGTLESGEISEILETGLECGRKVLEVLDDNREQLTPVLEFVLETIAPDLELNLEQLSGALQKVLGVLENLKDSYDALTPEQRKQLVVCVGMLGQAAVHAASQNYAAALVCTISAVAQGVEISNSIEGSQPIDVPTMTIDARDPIELQDEYVEQYF